MIDPSNVLQIVVGLSGVFAAGFAAGKTAAWIRAILGAA